MNFPPGPLSPAAAASRGSPHWLRRSLLRLAADPRVLLGAALVLHVLLWGLASAVWAPRRPDDSLEQTLLSQHLQLEYGKHPPLPTWLLYAVNQLVGAHAGTTFVLGALCAAATSLLLFQFARPLIGSRQAALAAVLALDIEYMNAGTAYFNHNTVQLPLAMLTILLFHRALARVGRAHWLAFGLSCGLMLLAKFSAVVLFVAMAVYGVWSGRAKELRVWKGVALAAGACALLIAPYRLAMGGGTWSPDAYALSAVFPNDVKRIECLKSVWGFVTSQFAKVLPAVAVFALARIGVRRSASPESLSEAMAVQPFLRIVGFGPLVLTTITAIAAGARLLVGWGTTFHVLFPMWLVSSPRVGAKPPGAVLRRAVLLGCVMQIALWAVVQANGGRLPSLNRKAHHAPVATPPALADAVREFWLSRCDSPLRYVVSNASTGAALALRFGGEPYVADGNRPEFGRLLPYETRATYGAVVVVPVRAEHAHSSTRSSLEELFDDTQAQTTLILEDANRTPLRFNVGLLPPSSGGGCDGSSRQ